jgi:helix-turn-helix protein
MEQQPAGLIHDDAARDALEALRHALDEVADRLHICRHEPAGAGTADCERIDWWVNQLHALTGRLARDLGPRSQPGGAAARLSAGGLTGPKAARGSQPPPYFTAPELAARLRTSYATLKYWRLHGKGPRFIRVGKKVVYPISEVQAWERDALRLENPDHDDRDREA